MHHTHSATNEFTCKCLKIFTKIGHMGGTWMDPCKTWVKTSDLLEVKDEI